MHSSRALIKSHLAKVEKVNVSSVVKVRVDKWVVLSVSRIICLFLSFVVIATPVICEEEIPKNYGYVLITLNDARSQASLVFGSNKARKSKSILAYENSERYTKSRLYRYKLTDVDVDRGYILLQLPHGDYSIHLVEVPYFDLPFRVNTLNRDNWRFSVEKKHINYVGELSVSKKRTRSAVHVTLRDRIIKNLKDIRKKLDSKLVLYPLMSGRYQRDDIWMLIKGD